MPRLTPLLFPFAILAGLLTACESSIRPLLPMQRVELWVYDEPDSTGSTQPASQSATQFAATSPDTQPATRPGHIIVKYVDPNQVSRFVYQASYDNIWRQATMLITKAGFSFDRLDYRMGVLTTKPLPSSQFIEFWKPQVSAKDSIENGMHSQRRIINLSISKVPGKADFFELGIQVLVQRESNPTEQLEGPVFVEGSGFGRNRLSLQSDYAATQPEPERWYTVGHDPDLESKLLNELLLRL